MTFSSITSSLLLLGAFSVTQAFTPVNGPNSFQQRTVFSASAVATLPAPTMTRATKASTTTQICWEISKATDDDFTMVSNFLKLKTDFDRSLNGETNNSINPKSGSTLESLFPELRNGQVLFATEKQPEFGPATAQPVGFCTYNFQYFGLGGRPVLWLDDIFVNPKIRSQGAGKAFMDELVAIGKKQRCTNILWSCDARNTRGLAFYNKLGAAVTGEKGFMKKYAWVPDSWSI